MARRNLREALNKQPTAEQIHFAQTGEAPPTADTPPLSGAGSATAQLTVVPQAKPSETPSETKAAPKASKPKRPKKPKAAAPEAPKVDTPIVSDQKQDPDPEVGEGTDKKDQKPILPIDVLTPLNVKIRTSKKLALEIWQDQQRSRSRRGETVGVTKIQDLMDEALELVFAAHEIDVRALLASQFDPDGEH